MNLEEIGRAEHYHLVRTSAEYRNFIMLEEMKAEMEPSRCQDIPERTEVHYVDTEFTTRQWDIITQLRGEVKFLSSKVNQMRANASKRKTDRYTEYT